MPELPEVETIARQLREGRHLQSGEKHVYIPPLVGRTIVEAHVLWAREVGGLSAKAFERQTAGRRVSSVGRHGKYLIVNLARDGEPASAMLIHLRMSGRLDVVPQAAAYSKHARVVWLLDEGWALRFDDARKFGRVLLVDEPARITGSIGPDALLIPADEFVSRVRQKRRALKPLLLDQTFIAGVGNIYADEALFLAGLHPRRTANTLSAEDALRLHAAIRQVLLDGVAANGASFDWVYPGGNYQEHFRVYGQTGKPCQNCGLPIKRIVVAQRGTHYCENCQK